MGNLHLGNDTNSTKLGGYYSGLYYYVLSDKLAIQGGEDNSQVLGNAPCIQSILYLPFLDVDNFDLKQCVYDKERFGSEDNPTVVGNPYVFRYDNNNKIGITRELKEFNNYNKKNNIEVRSYVNESKLQHFPYSYYMVNDFMNAPLILKPQLLQNKGENTIKAKITISDKATYNIFCEGYKGDKVGNTEGFTSSCSLDMPVSSNAYTQFMASNKSQFMTGNICAVTDSLMNIGANLATGNILGGAMGAVGGFEKIMSNMAQKNDLLSAPRSIKTMGGDVLYSLYNSDSKIDLIKYQIQSEFLERIGTYFALFGYKQNKMMYIDLKSRYYYNYIKCYIANIEGVEVPKDHLEKIKSIFENGTTIWHMDNEGVECMDYSKDNKEMY